MGSVSKRRVGRKAAGNEGSTADGRGRFEAIERARCRARAGEVAAIRANPRIRYRMWGALHCASAAALHAHPRYWLRPALASADEAKHATTPMMRKISEPTQKGPEFVE